MKAFRLGCARFYGKSLYPFFMYMVISLSVYIEFYLVLFYLGFCVVLPFYFLYREYNFWDNYVFLYLKDHGMPDFEPTISSEVEDPNKDGSNKIYLVSNGEYYLLPYDYSDYGEAMNEASPDLKEEYKRAITLFRYYTLVKQLEKHYLNFSINNKNSTINSADIIPPEIRKVLPGYLADVGDKNPVQTIDHLEQLLSLDEKTKKITLLIHAFLFQLTYIGMIVLGLLIIYLFIGYVLI